MAESIEYVPRPRDVREENYHKLQLAPREHTDALLDAYEVLQLLRDKGILELAKGLLGSGEKVLGVLTQTLESDEVVRIIRNLIILTKILAAIEPEVLEKFMQAMTKSANAQKKEKPPGLRKVITSFASEDSRRALAPLIAALEAVGRELKENPAPGTKPPRPKTTRHAA